VSKKEKGKGFQQTPRKNLVSYFIYTISLPLISFDSPVTHSTTRICLIRENERQIDGEMKQDWKTH